MHKVSIRYSYSEAKLNNLTMLLFENNLPSNSFYRLHRSYMINLNKIDVIEDGSVNIGKKWIPISRKLKEEFLQILKERGVYK